MDYQRWTAGIIAALLSTPASALGAPPGSGDDSPRTVMRVGSVAGWRVQVEYELDGDDIYGQWTLSGSGSTIELFDLDDEVAYLTSIEGRIVESGTLPSELGQVLRDPERARAFPPVCLTSPLAFVACAAAATIVFGGCVFAHCDVPPSVPPDDGGSLPPSNGEGGDGDDGEPGDSGAGTGGAGSG